MSVQDFEKSFVDSFRNTVPEGRLSLTVYSIKNKKWLHQIDADSPYRPASTLKTMTTASALEWLGPEYRFQTPVRFYGEKYGKTFWGRLEIEGTGDPSNSTRFHQEGEFSEFALLARNIRAIGIDTLWGEVELVNPRFEDVNYPEVWEHKFDNRCFGAKISPWIFQENCLDIVVEKEEGKKQALVRVEPFLKGVEIASKVELLEKGRTHLIYGIDPQKEKVSVTGQVKEEALPLSFEFPVRDPKRIFLEAVKRAFAENGVIWNREEVKKDYPEYRNLMWTGRTLKEVVDVVNTRSHNLFAELVLRQVPFAHGERGDKEQGIKWVKKFLHREGINDSSWVIKDGSGLSYQNRVVPRHINLILQKILKKPYGDIFQKSLNYATETGASGTRMTEMIYPWATRFKTGFVAETHGLVGYFYPSSGDTLVATLYVNDYKVPDYQVKKMMDRLWTQLENYYDPERASLMEMESVYQTLDHGKNIKERIDYFSKYFLGRPYLSPPTGEGTQGDIKREPLMLTSHFDCVTYLEHVMALTYATDSNQVFNRLQEIRYFKGEIGFSTRNHFFIEDWTKNNGTYLKPFETLNDLKAERTTGRKKFYGFHHLKFTGEDPITPLSYISKAKVKEVLSQPWQGEDKVLVGALVDQFDWLWVSHTGFVFLKKGEIPTFRHASAKEGHVVEMKLAEYLASRERILGLALYELVEPQ